MNLQPLYDVKDRLEAAAVAGTGLLSEDFRLKRAAEGLKPLAAASPVFAKLDGGLQKLLAAPPEARSGLLLDVLSLADAVAYTQAKTGAEGELEPLPAGSGRYCQLSRAQLQPILDALTGTGGGRMNQLKDAWENHPEYFADYRVLPNLVAGLGDSYGELAELNAKILTQIGPAALPLLKQNFDPAGKKEMARRVEVMDAVAGASENEWYLAQLPGAKKEAREALIFALRHAPSNREKLIELCRTEKKDCQAAAHRALARLDDPETLPYWRELAEKDPDQVLDYMRWSPTRTAAYLTASLFSGDLVRYGPDCPLDGKVWEHISKLLFALDGKTGPEIWQVYRDAAALGTALDREVETEQNGRKKKEPMGFWCYIGSEKRPFSLAVPNTLMHSIQLTRDKDLCALANELFERCGGAWAASALCAALLTQDGAGAYRRAEEVLRAKPHLFSLKKPVDRQAVLKDVLWALLWNGDTGVYAYLVNCPQGQPPRAAQPSPLIWESGVTGRSPRMVLPDTLDPRWFELLMDAGGLDANLMNLARPVEGPIGGKLGKYLYQKAVRCGDSQLFTRYTKTLIDLGWTDWRGYWSKRVQAVGEADYYSIQNVLDRLPIPGSEKAAQLQEVTDLIWAKKVKARHGTWPDAQVRQYIAQWKNE